MALKDNVIKTDSVTNTVTLDFNNMVEKTTNPNAPKVKIETMKDTSNKPSISTNNNSKTQTTSVSALTSPTIPGTTILQTKATLASNVPSTDKILQDVMSSSNYSIYNTVSSTDKKFGIFDKSNIDCNTNDYLKKSKASRNNNKKLIDRNASDCIDSLSITDDVLLNIKKVKGSPNVLKIGGDVNLDSFIKTKVNSLLSKDIKDTTPALSNLTTVKDSTKLSLLKNIKDNVSSTSLSSKLYNTLTGCGPGIFDDLLSLDYDFNLNMFKGLFDSVSCDSPDKLLTVAKSLFSNGGDPKTIVAGLIPSGIDTKNPIANILNIGKLKKELDVDTSNTNDYTDIILNGVDSDKTYNTQDHNSYNSVTQSLDDIVPTWNKDESNNVSYHKVKENNNLIAMAESYIKSKDFTMPTTTIIANPIDTSSKLKIASVFV